MNILLSFTILYLIALSEASWPNPDCSPCHCSITYSEKLQKRVRYANCSRRRLTEIPVNIPTDVEELDASHNDIVNLDAETFQAFYAVKSLNLAHNKIVYLPEELFINATVLQYLDIAGNILKDLLSSVFLTLGYMRHMEGLTVASLPLDIFQNLTKLRYLSFKTKQTELPVDLLETLSLSSLSIETDNMETVPPDLLDPCKQTLKEFRLSGKKLKSLPDKMFSKCGLLEKVSIYSRSENLIIPEGIFRRETPDFSQYPIEFRDLLIAVTKTSSNIREVCIHAHTNLPVGIFQNLGFLEKLTLRHTGGTNRQHLQDLAQLEYLNLSLNGITSLSGSWFTTLPGLKILDLNQNEVTAIDDTTFLGLQALQKLRMSHNQLVSLTDKVFQPFKYSIVDLDLSNNTLSYLSPSILKEMWSLERLNLAGNQLRELTGDLFHDTSMLRFLDFSYNRIRTVPQYTFENAADLMELYLQCNALESIPAFFLDGAISLYRLDLSNNSISNFPRNFLPRHFLLEYISLDGNPTVCDCSLVNLLFYFHHSGTTKTVFNGQCVLPDKLAGREISSLWMTDVCEPNEISETLMNKTTISPADMHSNTTSLPQDLTTTTVHPIASPDTWTTIGSTQQTSGSTGATTLPPTTTIITTTSTKAPTTRTSIPSLSRTPITTSTVQNADKLLTTVLKKVTRVTMTTMGSTTSTVTSTTTTTTKETAPTVITDTFQTSSDPPQTTTTLRTTSNTTKTTVLWNRNQKVTSRTPTPSSLTTVLTIPTFSSKLPNELRRPELSTITLLNRSIDASNLTTTPPTATIIPRTPTEISITDGPSQLKLQTMTQSIEHLVALRNESDRTVEIHVGENNSVVWKNDNESPSISSSENKNVNQNVSQPVYSSQTYTAARHDSKLSGDGDIMPTSPLPSSGGWITTLNISPKTHTEDNISVNVVSTIINHRNGYGDINNKDAFTTVKSSTPSSSNSKQTTNNLRNNYTQMNKEVLNITTDSSRSNGTNNINIKMTTSKHNKGDGKTIPSSTTSKMGIIMNVASTAKILEARDAEHDRWYHNGMYIGILCSLVAIILLTGSIIASRYYYKYCCKHSYITGRS